MFISPKLFRHLLTLAALTTCLGLVACGASGEGKAAGAKTSLPQAPLKIPMPLDKAGHKVDVTFEVPPSPKGESSRGYFVGLRVLFAPAMGQVQVVDQNPVVVRLFMHRLENGQEIRLPFVKLVNTALPLEPSKFEALPIQNDTATSTGRYSDHSGAPPGTPDASTYVLSFAATEEGDEPGIYRLQAETLKDLPALQGFKAFLVYERLPNR